MDQILECSPLVHRTRRVRSISGAGPQLESNVRIARLALIISAHATAHWATPAIRNLGNKPVAWGAA
jgi:hypothetical protein